MCIIALTDAPVSAYRAKKRKLGSVTNLLRRTEQRPANDELRWIYYPLEMAMRHRGREYWAWADCLLDAWTHDEVLSDGTQIDVQVRLSRKAETQLFIGVYTKEGRLQFEEFYPALGSMAMAHALVLGVDRASALATGTGVSDRISQAH